MDPGLQPSTGRLVAVVVAVALALTFVPAGVDAAGPALMRLVDGNGDTRAQVDNGKVRVGDGNGRLTVNGNVRALPPLAVHGFETIDFSTSTATPRSFDLPRNVVLTDAVLTRAGTSTGDPCTTWLFETNDGAIYPIFQFRPTAAEPVDQLHFESGVAPTADTFGFFLNSNCRVEVLWSGYRRR